MGPKIGSLEVSAYRVPLEQPETDGTLEWDATSVVAVEVTAGDVHGLGWTYGSVACGSLIHEMLRNDVIGRDSAARTWRSSTRAFRQMKFAAAPRST